MTRNDQDHETEPRKHQQDPAPEASDDPTKPNTGVGSEADPDDLKCERVQWRGLAPGEHGEG